MKSERYAQNGKTFDVFMDQLRALIGVNFVMEYYKMPNLRGYWGTGSPSLIVIIVENVMKTEMFKGIMGNLHFPNNEDVVPWDHPANHGAFKVR